MKPLIVGPQMRWCLCLPLNLIRGVNCAFFYPVLALPGRWRARMRRRDDMRAARLQRIAFAARAALAAARRNIQRHLPGE